MRRWRRSSFRRAWKAGSDVCNVHGSVYLGALQVTHRELRNDGIDLDELETTRSAQVMQGERDGSDAGAEVHTEGRAPDSCEGSDQERIDVGAITAFGLIDQQSAGK